jgi:hypothetical protein
MSDGIAEPDHQFEPLPGVKFSIRDELVKGPAADELHGEKGLLRDLTAGARHIRDAGFIDARNTRVLELSEKIRFMAKASKDARRRTWSHKLQGHPAVRVLLLCLIDNAHAAFADLADQLKSANLYRHRELAQNGMMSTQKASLTAIVSQQEPFDRRPQLRVTCATPAQQLLALRGGPIASFRKKLLDQLCTVGVH